MFEEPWVSELPVAVSGTPNPMSAYQSSSVSWTLAEQASHPFSTSMASKSSEQRGSWLRSCQSQVRGSLK